MHLAVQRLAREWRPGRDGGIVVVEEFNAAPRVEGFHMRASPLAKGTCAVEENLVIALRIHPSTRNFPGEHYTVARSRAPRIESQGLRVRNHCLHLNGCASAARRFSGAGREDQSLEGFAGAPAEDPRSARSSTARDSEFRSLGSWPGAPWRTWDNNPFLCLRREGWPVRSSRGCSRSIRWWKQS